MAASERPTIGAGSRPPGQVPERPRAVRVGAFAAVAHENAAMMRRLADRVASHGYGVCETPHFVICRKPPARLAIVMHVLAETTVDDDLASWLAEELGPPGVLASEREYGEALFAIVASTCPPALNCPRCGHLHLDHPSIWRHYGVNTLRRMRPLLADGVPTPDSHVGRFAGVYRAIVERRAGASLLDVGSNLGLLPVLLGELDPGLTVVGCDSRPEAVASAADLAAATGGTRVTFALADVLAPGFPEIGRFDTVTAVHLLEHLAEAELPRALANLLGAATRRLIVSVPYEHPVQPLYGHRQAFTPERLRGWGRWCVEKLGGRTFRCEEVEGGLLVVDRAAR